MFGGFKEFYEIIGLVLEKIFVYVDGEFCCVWMGIDGVGYFVKMVYNGIEYVDM